MGGTCALRTVSGWVVAEGQGVEQRHAVLVERPLTIRLAGEPVTTTLRTPGEDHLLALGWLFSEGVVRSRDDVGSMVHCGRTDQPGYGDTLDVLPAPGTHLALEPRPQLVTSACGACGHPALHELSARLVRPRAAYVPAALLRAVPRLLRSVQPLFGETGGAHGACAINARGEVLAQSEDVGRHNAVDKVVGRLVLDGLLPDPARPERPTLLAVSARAGFELVQKAAVAGFSCLATLSAPSSLAIEAAEAAGLTLASFVRDGRYTLYSHPARIEDAP
jgi:FdhD protein